MQVIGQPIRVDVGQRLGQESFLLIRSKLRVLPQTAADPCHDIDR